MLVYQRVPSSNIWQAIPGGMNHPKMSQDAVGLAGEEKNSKNSGFL